MSLIDCPECRKSISDKATTCPQCGFPLKRGVVNHVLGKTYESASTGTRKVVDAVARKKAKLKALAACIAIFVIGSLLFPFAMYFGAICMCIYSLTLFKVLHVVWKKYSVNFVPVDSVVQVDQSEATRPVDDSRFMPPSMRSFHSGDTQSPTHHLLEKAALKPDTKIPADTSLGTYLGRAFLAFVFVGIVSLTLRPVLKSIIRESNGTQTPAVPAVTNHSSRVPITTIKTDNALEDDPFFNNPSRKRVDPDWLVVTNFPHIIFSYPVSSMELQTADDQETGNSFKRQKLGVTNGLDHLLFRIQQKGLRDREADAFLTYMRISMTRESVTSEAFSNVNTFAELSEKELLEYNKGFCSNLEELKQTHIRNGQTFQVLSQPTTRLSVIAGIPAIKTVMNRKVGANPAVIQTQYLALKNGYLYTVITQFRDCESMRWQKAIQTVVDSIQIKDGAESLPFARTNQTTQTTNINVRISSSCQKIQLGESFNLTIEVEDTGNGIDVPSFSGGPNAELIFQGQNRKNNSTISVLNGRVSRKIWVGRVFSYTIKPRERGVFNTGPINITVAGKTHTQNGISVVVR